MAKTATAIKPDFDPKAPAIYFDQNDPNSRSVTNQSDKDSTDINLMFARYEKTGLITDLMSGNLRKPIYGDFTNVGDFHQLQDTIAKVNQAFDALPATTRNLFANDPAKLIDFLADPKNDKEAVKLGLKDENVLKTALADDGKTPIFPEERESLDRAAGAAKLAEAAKAAKPQPATPAA